MGKRREKKRIENGREQEREENRKWKRMGERRE